MRLDHLPAMDENRNLRVVVECPRGSTVKLKYEPSLCTFRVKRALPQGLAYPFDWGFIPGTVGDDGDPVDALVLHGTGTYPGVVMDCRPLGMVDVTQNKPGGRVANPRLIVVPTWYQTPDGDISALSAQFKQEIANFFATAGYFAGSEPRIEGWRSADEANAHVHSAIRYLGGA
ncbi:MAG: inorganic diphosphatase [Halobacteriota archaeon]